MRPIKVIRIRAFGLSYREKRSSLIKFSIQNHEWRGMYQITTPLYKKFKRLDDHIGTPYPKNEDEKVDHG